MAGLGMIFKTLGKSTDEAVEIAAKAGREAGEKAGAKMYKREIKNIAKDARKEAMDAAYNRGIKEASMPKAAGTGTDIYFKSADGVEYRRVANPNYDGGKRKYSGGQHNRYLYQQRTAGEGYVGISGKQFGEAKQAYGGAGYASYDDMLMGERNLAQQIAEENAASGPGLFDGIGDWVKDHQLLVAGGLVAGTVLLTDD